MKDLIKKATQYLQESAIHEPRLQAEEILASVLGIPRLNLNLYFDRPLTEAEKATFKRRLLLRSLRLPIQRIENSVSFYGIDIHLTDDVLIPRQETEILADKIASCLKDQPLDDKEFWDVCTGSGCLGLSIKNRFPGLNVTLSDLSERALDQAKQNAKINGLSVNFLEGDMLAPFLGKKADFIVCNPPYISSDEYKSLDPEVRLFDPKSALVSGSTGLECYMTLREQLPLVLNPSGKVFLEIGWNQGEALVELFSAPFWKTKRVIKDWSSHDRFFFLEIE
ncbi:MAG: peptide chain release factor N(5)-glutamine methyltransferase [Waddliaceae bacterium]